MNALASKILAGAAALAVAFAAGWFACSRFELADDAADAKQETAVVIDQAVQARDGDREIQKEVNNEDAKLQERLAVVSRERDDAVDRLRKYKAAEREHASAVPTPAGDPGKCDGPPASRLSEEDGAVALRRGKEADDIVEQLNTAQAILLKIQQQGVPAGKQE